MSRPILMLADLQEYDPEATDRVYGETRYLCPLCGDGKPQDDAHRSLSLNPETGGWYCHRCDEKGYVPELRQPDSNGSSGHASRTQAQLARAFAVPSRLPGETEIRMDPSELLKRLKGMVALEESPGEAYLTRRGIPVEIAAASRVKFHSDFSGRWAVVFGIYDGTGQLVAAHGRYMDQRHDPAMRTFGKASAGVFATSGALAAKTVAIVEAPIDALSLSMGGVPALALMGTNNRPAWLPRALAGRTVLVATDSDEPGEQSAASITEWLRPMGTRCWRLLPTGGKDWNEVLCAVGQAALAAQLADALAPLSASLLPRTSSGAPADAASPAASPRARALPGDRLKSEARPWLCHGCLLYFGETELVLLEEDRFGRLRCSHCHAGEPLSPDQESAKAHLLAALKVEDPMEGKARHLRAGWASYLEDEDLDFLDRYARFIPPDQRTQILKNAKQRVRVEQAADVWMKAHGTWRALIDEQRQLQKGASSDEQLGMMEAQVQTAWEEAEMLHAEWGQLKRRWEGRSHYSRYGK